VLNPPRPPGLIQRYREELEARHYAKRTVESYEQWLRRFLRFHSMRHPREMGSEEVNAFLTHLAVEGNVSASTQNPGLIQSPSQASLPGLSAWVEVGGIASSLCSKALPPPPIST
jgi:hypothetical protein